MNKIINTHFCEIAKVGTLSLLTIHDKINVRDAMERDRKIFNPCTYFFGKDKSTRNERGAVRMIETFINRYKKRTA